VNRQKLIECPARWAIPIATTFALAAMAVPLPEKLAPSASARYNARPGSTFGACAAVSLTTGFIVAV
jgi:hypothetical protein